MVSSPSAFSHPGTLDKPGIGALKRTFDLIGLGVTPQRRFLPAFTAASSAAAPSLGYPNRMICLARCFRLSGHPYLSMDFGPEPCRATLRIAHRRLSKTQRTQLVTYS